MPKTTFTSEELSRYFNGQVKHKAYNETTNMAHEMCVHAEGIFPKTMIEERRPSENRKVMDYRQKIWKAITKPIIGKVFTELNKIRRSSDWNIKYDDSKVPVRIIASETLKEYCEVNYPFFNSVTNWVFKMMMPGYCKDANAVIAIMPVGLEVIPNEYIRPFGYMYKSENVIEFVQDDFAIIKSTDKVLYTTPEGVKTFGDIYYIFTTDRVERWEQAGSRLEYHVKWTYQHNIGKLPVFRVEGSYKTSYDGTFVYESRLSSMLPRLDEALREYGDLQAEVVQHIFSEKWEMISDDCSACKGKGKVKTTGFLAEDIVCGVCEGSGARQRGPFQNLQIRQPMAGEAAIPTPPAGYIQKNVDIVKIQDERVDKHIYNALSAINMEYLAETPLNESGKAKEVDKDSLNNFVHAIAEDLVAAMDRLYFFINEYRYGVVLPNAEQRQDMLPYINVPEKFDLLSTTYLEDRIAKSKENKGNPIIINAMEEDYINKMFVGDVAMRERILLTIKLDPLSGISEEDKITRLSNKGITEETYIISSNIREFIDRAMEEKGDAFFKMKFKEQKELMMEYAKEQVESTSAAASILSDFESETQRQQLGQQSGQTVANA